MSDTDDGTTSAPSGVVLFAGGTDFENMLKRLPSKGKQPTEAEIERSEFYQDLLSPHRLLSLDTIRIQFIASGCAALHAVAVDTNGSVYVWGRNLEGQLGLGDRIQRNQPVKVPGISDVISGSCGRAHTVLVESNGKAMSVGENKFGQLGQDSDVGQTETFAEVSLSKKVVKSSCGSDFTLLLTDEGMLYACGSGENGCLGDGSTHTYNSRSHSIKMEVEPQPKPKLISGLENIVNMASGVNHSVCATEGGSVFTWGCGDYGRLGNGVQKDELRPKRLEWFSGPRSLPADCLLACGGTSTIVSGSHGTYWWGKVKTSGDSMMTPTVCEDLRGWKVRSVSASKATFGVSAESSTILWGQAIHGELAGGVNGKKTSARPAKCMPVEGMLAHQVASGNGFTIFLMDDSEAAHRKKLASFALYEAPELDPFASGAAAQEEPPSPEPAKKKAGRSKRKRGQ